MFKLLKVLYYGMNLLVAEVKKFHIITPLAMFAVSFSFFSVMCVCAVLSLSLFLCVCMCVCVHRVMYPIKLQHVKSIW